MLWLNWSIFAKKKWISKPSLLLFQEKDMIIVNLVRNIVLYHKEGCVSGCTVSRWLFDPNFTGDSIPAGKRQRVFLRTPFYYSINSVQILLKSMRMFIWCQRCQRKGQIWPFYNLFIFSWPFDKFSRLQNDSTICRLDRRFHLCCPRVIKKTTKNHSVISSIF